MAEIQSIKKLRINLNAPKRPFQLRGWEKAFLQTQHPLVLKLKTIRLRKVLFLVYVSSCMKRPNQKIYFALVSNAKQIEIKTIPIQPIGASCSPTNRIAKTAATKGSNNVKVMALLAGTVFKPYPNKT